MIPKIYDKDNNYIGELPFCTRGLVIEERNGMFELELDYRLFHTNYEYLVRGNIIEVDANDKQKSQLFRIYKVTKDILGQFSVYASHISYDIARDITEGLDITNQSCEYCLNQLFRGSQFSQKFKGYSDIVNAQDYAIGPTNLMLAIAGTSGSIIDTFGTGAEILRDNYDFHVLNKRGDDNGVVIQYASNLTGLDYEEDDTSLITRIRAIARYTPEGENAQEQMIYTYVDSPNIGAYETPFISEIDFSDKFEDGVVPTVSKLQTYAREYFNKNKCDRVKFSYKISFIPLSKCVGYEGIEDQIDLCDTVRIIDSRYELDTQAKVIKVTYDFLRDRYDSMELGEPRTSLGDIVAGDTEPPAGPQGPKGEKGEDGEAFPDILPTTPVLSCKLYGFASIELSWTFENRVFFTYELYASKTQGFTPNEFDLIHEGQTSSFLFQAEPSETWYFRVCGKNSYGNRTSFSEEIEVTTTKIEDLSNYVGEMAIGEALIGELSLGRGWVGQLNASLLDVKGNFSVTDGNGKRTLDIDSFGNVYLDVTQLQINSSAVPNKDYVDDSIASIKIDSEKIDFLVEKGSTSSNMKLTAEAIKMISDSIDLTGKVTFNSLGGGLKDQIDTTTELIDNWVYEDVETQTTLIDGGKIKTGSITADKIAVGAIAVDQLKSNNENPIIRLFDECAIDATKQHEKGQGDAIRLKWDDYNYILIAEDYIQFYSSGGGESAILTLSGDTSDTYLSNYGGKCELKLSQDGAYINDGLILTEKNFKEYCAEADHTHDDGGGGGYGGEGLYESLEVDTITVRKIQGPDPGEGQFNRVEFEDAIRVGHIWAIEGNSAIDFQDALNVHGTIGVEGDINAEGNIYCNDCVEYSDKSLKENIRYINNTNSKARMLNNEDLLDRSDLYDFIINQINLCEYNFIGDDYKKIGFIANDYTGSKIGDIITRPIKKDIFNDKGEKIGTDEILGYKTSDLLFSVIGALQEEVLVRDNQINELESRVEWLENKLNELLNKGQD